ncbi:MAG: hypothetical protein HRT77_14135 [Halioglobus sp.]|nr:hypothetical protein [Halioglobus sp.]
MAANILAKAGSRFRSRHDRATCRLAKTEQRWIERWRINPNHLFDLMSLYPTLQRVFFVHIPKCGGTSVRQQLVTTYSMAPVPIPSMGAIRQSIDFMDTLPTPSQTQPINQALRTSTPFRLREEFLQSFAIFLARNDPRQMFVLGHQKARELRPLLRPGTDLVMTTVRPPLDILRSMVIYRIDHTLKNPQRFDSLELLEALQLRHTDLKALVSADPRTATERILALTPLSLASYLALDDSTDHEAIWNGIQTLPLYIAHVSELDHMLATLFGGSRITIKKNSSEGRAGLTANFAAALRDEWLAPFIDSDSAQLYQRIDSSGIIGFWQKGGTIADYQRLLAIA